MIERRDPLERLPDACQAVLHAEAALLAARHTRDEALRELRSSGVPARRVGAVARRRLVDAGWPEDLVTARAVGLSDGNVKRLLERA